MQIELPGLFDLQVNGFAGVDFNHPGGSVAAVSRALDALAATGVTRCLPTLITASREHFAACVTTVLSTHHPLVAGIHLEGPYLSPVDGPRGAHSAAALCAASRDDFDRRQEAAEGQIRLVTLAPEVPGALDLIEYLTERGIRVALGHTAATPEQIQAAVSAGATLSTHLGNGCHLQMARHPNLLWAQLACDALQASLIVDGHHLPAATVKAMVRAKRPEQVILISDAMAAAGCGPGTYELAGQPVVVSADGRATPPGQPWLAGSTLTLDRAVANTVQMTGLPLAAVWPMASEYPAAYLNLPTAGRVVVEWEAASGRLQITRVIPASQP